MVQALWSLTLGRSSARLGWQAAPLCAALIAVAWVVSMTQLHPAQFGDSIEQYNWAHSLEWGYWKHPPLTTWLMRGAIALVGVSHWTAPLVAIACLVAATWFFWRIASMLLPRPAASLAVMLWPLLQVLAARGEVYNHNRTLVMLCAAMAWAALRASRSRRTRDWLLFGLLAGLGMLAKYQAAVTVIGVLVAMHRMGELRDAGVRRQLAASAAVAFVVFLPHWMWALREALPTLRYVCEISLPLGPVDRVLAVLRFAGVQVGILLPMLAAAAAAFFAARRLASRGPSHATAADAQRQAWLVGLVLVPALVVVAVVLAGGVKPQKMWGIHTLMFLPLWLAWRITQARAPEGASVAAGAVAAVITLASAGVAVAELSYSPLRSRMWSVDAIFPASDIARAATFDWQRATGCPLRYVAGDPFPAGLVSVYSGAYPQVLESKDRDKSPWIAPDQLAAAGAISVQGPVARRFVPSGVSWMSVPTPAKASEPQAVWWYVIPPRDRC